MKVGSSKLHQAGCLFEYGDLSNASISKYAFGEAIQTCNNKSMVNICSRAEKIMRKILSSLSNQELFDRIGVRYYADYYKEDRDIMIKKICKSLCSSVVIQFQEWREINESIDTGR